MSVVLDSAPEAAQPVRGKKARWIALAVFALVAALILVLATRPSAESQITANPLVGDDAPNISGIALDGRNVSLDSMKGRWVVVNFFATWCVPCRVEHPELKQFEAQHQGANSPTILAVAYDKNDIDSARSWFAQQGGDWPVVPDSGGTAISYGVRGLPESYVVNPDGKIAAQVTGGVTAAELNAFTGQVA